MPCTVSPTAHRLYCVTELPLAMEAVTRDTFADGLDTTPASRHADAPTAPRQGSRRSLPPGHPRPVRPC